MIGAPEWRRDGRDWPNRTASRFVRASGIEWHVQIMGQGPALLLLHGTGAATHSWRGLAPLLARRFTVVASDLPGHGFTGHLPRSQAGLPGMARAVAGLLRTLDKRPNVVVGHSAGAAIAARMVLDRLVAPAALVSINGALLPLPGPGAVLFPAAARLLAATPVVPWIFSLQASNRDTVDRLLARTGSRIDAEGARLYARLLARPGHAAGTLRMMSQWDLQDLGLSRLALPVMLVWGEEDGMVPPSHARRLHRLLPHARLAPLPGLGHLAHEEAPERVAKLIEDLANDVGVLTLEGCA